MVKFNNIDMFTAYGFVLSSKDLGSPTPKVITVDVLGGDGVLDFTEYFGEPKYNNRQMVFVFSKEQTKEEFVQMWSVLQNKLNGQKVYIDLAEDPEFYYTGRIISMVYTRDKTITQITITVDAEPYKLKHIITEVYAYGTKNVVLNNLKKSVVPSVYRTSDVKIIFGNIEVNLSAGTSLVPELMLSEGANLVRVEQGGNQKVIFSYQEGGF